MGQVSSEKKNGTSLSIFLLNCWRRERGAPGYIQMFAGRDKDKRYELGGNGKILSVPCND